MPCQRRSKTFNSNNKIIIMIMTVIVKMMMTKIIIIGRKLRCAVQNDFCSLCHRAKTTVRSAECV